jgi:hypothetical protein
MLFFYDMNHAIWIIFFIFSCSTKTVTKQPTRNSHKRTYVRSDWKHWNDKDGNCLDTRAETLKSRSLSIVVMNKRGCKVKYGKWKDYYYPEIHTVASKVDIDHLVPLKHAHDVGASTWSLLQKEKFANDPDNLVITNLRYNRQKGAKGIDEWLPRHKDYACKYVSDWVRIKKKYALKLRPTEHTSIAQLQDDCHF